MKRYAYATGNLELVERVNAGEPLPEVIGRIKAMWTPGNEGLWDEYDPESLVDTEERAGFLVNQLLCSRITIYRALRDARIEPAGRDPFELADRVPDVLAAVRARFPAVLGPGRQGPGAVS